MAIVSELHLSEVEKTLLYISEARERAERARKELERGGAEQHLMAALKRTEDALSAEHHRLMQETFFAVPADQDRLPV